MKPSLALSLLGFALFAPSSANVREELVELEPLRQEIRRLREQVAEQREELVRRQAVHRRLQNFTALQIRLDALEAKDFSHEGAMDSIWVLLCGALVMFMHAGFALLETGSCRAKNCQNVLMKNMVNVCVGTLGWWCTGWAFAYGEQAEGSNGFMGSTEFFGIGFLSFEDGLIDPFPHRAKKSKALDWFFQWAFCTAGATIVSGGVAERVKSPTYAFFAFCMSAFIYPAVAAWSWGGGWLSDVMDVGFMDFAGSGVVHLCGGTAALAGTVVLGPRTGRWETPEDFEPHNLPLVVMGTFALWFGWYGFNPGSTLEMHNKETGALAAQVAMNSTMSAAVGGITVFLIRYAILKKYDVGGLCNGILAGLVSITAGCANVEVQSACVIGFLGAIVYQIGSMSLTRLRIDDPVDAVPVHGCCGAWACLATVFFDWGKGLDYYHGWSGFECFKKEGETSCMSGAAGNAFVAQLVMIVVVILWSGTLSTLCFLSLRLSGMLRVGIDVEFEGMDSRQHSPPKAYAMQTPHVETLSA